MSAPPTQDELLALAQRALANTGRDAQATARWTHEPGAAARTTVEIVVVRDGGAGRAITDELDDDGLERAARAAEKQRDGQRGATLGEPAPGRVHDGYDPAVLSLDAAPDTRAALEKTAIASTRGVRAYEQRSAVELRVRREAEGGRTLTLTEAAIGPGGLDAGALAAEATALLGDGEPVDVAPGEYPVVLSPWAVAEVLRRAAPMFAAPDGPLATRLGTRVVAPAVNLSDSPRFPGTLPRSYDVEGVPIQPLPLIQDGVAHRVVHDSTSAAAAGTASTGHATQPGGLGPPLPRHLVLVGGGAADLGELARPIAHGLLIAGLSGDEAEGVRVIRDGRIADAAPNLRVDVDPLAVLASVQALTARQRTIPAPGGATVAPGLRAGGGVRVD